MMTPQTILAIQKIVKKAQGEAARANVKEGTTYDIDTTVRIKGTISVGVGYRSSPTVSIPLKEALALFIVYSGLGTSAAALDALTRALRDAIRDTGKGEGEVIDRCNYGVSRMIDGALEMVENELIAKLPKTYKNGPVTTNLVLTELERLPTGG